MIKIFCMKKTETFYRTNENNLWNKLSNLILKARIYILCEYVIFYTDRIVKSLWLIVLAMIDYISEFDGVR
jgi:hypothetical protein